MSRFILKPWNRGITDAELLADLRRVAHLLGASTVRYSEYPLHGKCASRIFETRFGSWNAALKAACLQIKVRQNISDEELYENLERVWSALGRQPRRQEMRKPLSSVAKGTYERRFGGWRGALEKFVAYADGDIDMATPSRMQSPSPTNSRFPDLRTRWRVLNRDAFSCRSCGRSPALERGVILHVDHVIPWSKGGPTSDANLQTLCDRCNLGKGDA